MRTLRLPDRLVIIGVGAAFAAAVLLHLRPVGADLPLREAATNLGWTLTSILALAGSILAWRRSDDGSVRAGWRWLALGCAVDLAAQLGADYTLWRGAAPSRLVALDDVVFLAVHPFLLGAAWHFLRRGERRRPDLETALDTVLLTLLMAALAIEYYVPPVARSGVSSVDLILVVLHAASAGAIVWLVLVQLLRQMRFPRDPEGLALAGVFVYAVTNLLVTMTDSPATYAGGTLLDFGWHVGLSLMAVGGALGPSPGPSRAPAPAAAAPLLAPRLVVLIIAWSGIAWMITQPLLRGERAPGIALLVVAGIVALAVRSTVAFLTDRRYAARLERAVERHTRTLSDSLAQTAAAERDVRLLMEAVPDAIVVLDPAGRILELNDAARVMVRAPADLIPGTVFDYLDPAGAAFVREKLGRAFAGELVSFEVPFTRLDGSRGTSWVSYAPVRQGGEIRKVMALARDVTEQRRTEAQLQRAERLASLGQLVSGVAHEINNPAAIISGVAQTLLLEALSAEQREMAQTMYDEAIRIGGITTNLLTFARGSGTARTVVDVNDAVRRTLALRRFHHTSQGIRVTAELDPDAPQVWANPPEVLQLVLNLVLHAEDAVAHAPADRAITLRTRSQGTVVRLECADSGPAIDPEALSRVFDPFFTAHAGSGGTGLGLSACYGIVQTHGGEITADSAPERGTTFTVTLPRDASPVRRDTASEPGSAGARVTRVLLVEDEAGLRQAAVRFLARRNLTVVGVGDGEAALAAARASDFDVVVTDVRLPGISGREFVERLQRERPALGGRLVLATGDPRGDEARAIMAATGAACIDKPFDLERLEAVIRETAARVRDPA